MRAVNEKRATGITISRVLENDMSLSESNKDKKAFSRNNACNVHYLSYYRFTYVYAPEFVCLWLVQSIKFIVKAGMDLIPIDRFMPTWTKNLSLKKTHMYYIRYTVSMPSKSQTALQRSSKTNTWSILKNTVFQVHQ